jgi:hypothetical protein
MQSMHAGDGKFLLLVESLKGRAHLGDLGQDGRVI